jgi:2-keto-4-pentenoate hydratase
MMADPDLEAGARRLVEARRAKAKLTELPEAERPRTIADAYCQQHMATALWDDEVAGWKVGATSIEVQRLFGVTEPLFGPVFRRDTATSPASLPASAFQHRMLESEFSFHFGTDLPPRARRYTRAEILDAVESVSPSIEIISPRFDRLMVQDVLQLQADWCADGGAVLGPACQRWRERDLVDQAVGFSIAGIRRQKGTGALVLGSPLTVLEWFVDALAAQGLGLRAGQFVMTGTMTGIHAPEPGQPAAADFGDLGRAELVFTP